MNQPVEIALDEKKLAEAELEARALIELLLENPSVASINVVFWTDVYKMAEIQGRMGVPQ